MERGQKLSLVLVSIILGQLYGTCGADVIMNHYPSTYDVLCYDGCETHGYSYYWCNTRDGWDYCSPSENRDYKGNKCKDEHPCGNYGCSFQWCWTEAGSWGYCGKVEPKPLLYISSIYKRVCGDDCVYDEKWMYYWCYTDKGWDYCSPLPDVTYKNEQCRSDNHCGTHGKEYYWCWTVSSQDYCGLIRSNECRYDTSSLLNLEHEFLICTQNEKRETKFHADPSPTAIADVGRWRNEIINLISRWNNGYLRNEAKTAVITSEHLRIDLQGLVNWDNQHYYDLQIQVNEHHQPATSTTVAQVFIPQNADIPDRYVRRAFVESFHLRARVSVKVHDSCYESGKSVDSHLVPSVCYSQKGTV